MRRYRFPVVLIVLVLLLAGLRVSFGQGPLTNALNLRLRSDSNGALLVYGVPVGAQGPLTNLGNMMLRAYSPGSLAVALAGGVSTADPCWSSTTQDSYITEAILGANNPGVYSGGTSCVGGTLRWDWNASRIKFSYPVQLSDGTAAAPSLTFATATTKGLYNNSGVLSISDGTGEQSFNDDFAGLVKVVAGGGFGWAATTIGASGDLFLRRDAANTLACRNGTNPCLIRIDNTWTDINNNEYIEAGANAGGMGANEFGVMSVKNGSGTQRPITFGGIGGTIRFNSSGIDFASAPTAGTGYWRINTSGHLIGITDNTYDIGASGATRPRNVYVGSTIFTGTGTNAVAPLSITNGVNLTSATANAVENDGVARYFTHDTTNGRKVDDEWNFFELTGAGTGITTIADFFGATGSGIPLVSGGRYEIEWHCVFSQATAGTATWTIVTATTALAILDAHYVGSNIAGIGTVGAPQQAGVNTTASSSTALPVTGTEATAVTHMFDIHAIVTAGAGAGNTRLRLAMSAGTATPQAGSYFKVRRLPAANTGTFVS